MKKALALILIILSLTLSACGWIPSYDETLQSFEEHLVLENDLYLERIELLNQLTEEGLSGVVKIRKSSASQLTNSYGSGLIFDEDPFYYYVLTNNHIVYDMDPQGSIYQVYDYKDHIYNATLLANSNLYDLAVLRIRKLEGITLHVFSFAKENPDVDTHLVTMGYPESQLNTIHMGIVEQYGTVSIDADEDIINVTFHVIYAAIPVKSGSSGSATINDRFELVGIVFAGNFPQTGSVADYAFIIPIEQVKTFLTIYDFDYNEVTS
jgi:S1-C subfamily serine protease